MNKISGNIFSAEKRVFIKGHLIFDEKILRIEADDTIVDESYILPGLIDAHIHIESSMLSPVEYSRVALMHGVVAAVTDPHEIANVCGMDGVHFMIENAAHTPMKIFTGIPSCVPATDFECSGTTIGLKETEALLKSGKCSHLSEMMNFPGVIFDDPDVHAKIKLAQRFNKRIDGHAPMLRGDQLKKYVDAGISTDHECSTIDEALEKVTLGMKIMLRESSASKDFSKLDKLIELHPESIMFCTDDCHPDELQNHYIDDLVRRSLKNGYSIFDIFKASTQNAIVHYGLNVGLLQTGDCADFIVVDNLENFQVQKTYIDGREVFGENGIIIPQSDINLINNFFKNQVSGSDIMIEAQPGKRLNVIEVIPDSLLTKHITVPISSANEYLEPDVANDILKIVVLNRYQKAVPAVGFIKGFGLITGAMGGSIAHDSHNIVVIGTDDDSIIKAIHLIQSNRGGLVVANNEIEKILPLPIAGLMSDKPCEVIAIEYRNLNAIIKSMGSKLNAPFMTMAFMSLLVIPEIKLGDRGLFDGNQFKFIDLQS
jgi:adenine deaminase